MIVPISYEAVISLFKRILYENKQVKRFSPEALGDTQISKKKLFLPLGQNWKIECFYPLVNEDDTTLLALMHGNREASQLIQREMPHPNCHGGHKAQEDAANCRH